VETPFTVTPCGREHPSCDIPDHSGARPVVIVAGHITVEPQQRESYDYRRPRPSCQPGRGARQS
jgi:hypothetical protein